MFTRAAKDLLRNTISSVDHHNRVLEEQEMWRQWELERGLTMMVSDEALARRQRPQEQQRPLPPSPPAAGSSQSSSTQARPSSPERWDHNGYRELYPEEFESPRRRRRRRRRHSSDESRGCHRRSPRRRGWKPSSRATTNRSRSRHRHRDTSTSSSSSSGSRSGPKRRSRDSSTDSSSSSSSSSHSSGSSVWEERTS